MTTDQSNITNDLNKLYIELHSLIKGNCNHDKMIKIIKDLGTEYLSQPDPRIKDWGKDYPRYLHLYGKAFAEGHGLFDLLQTHIAIQLRDIDIIYLCVCGVFWRYHYDISIINYALIQLKKSDIYTRLVKIPYTLEIDMLLECSGVSSILPQFKKYGETLGYFNAHWLCDPSTYEEECKMIDY